MPTRTHVATYLFGLMATTLLMFQLAAPLHIDKNGNKFTTITAWEVLKVTWAAPELCSDPVKSGSDRRCSHLVRAKTYINAQGVKDQYEIRLIALSIYALASLSICVRSRRNNKDSLGHAGVYLLLLGSAALLGPDLLERGQYPEYNPGMSSQYDLQIYGD